MTCTGSVSTVNLTGIERESAQNERKSKKRKYTIERKLKLHSTENQIENSITEKKDRQTDR